MMGFRATAAALVVAAFALSGCAPSTPAASGAVRCDGGTLNVSVSPALGNEVRETSAALSNTPNPVGCDDRTGAGITSAQVSALTLDFPGVSYYQFLDAVGAGPATIKWSDGTSSSATVTASFSSNAPWSFDVKVDSGALAGYSASAPFWLSSIAGNSDGITAFAASFGDLTFTQS